MNYLHAMDIAKKKATEAYTNKYHTGAKLEVVDEGFQCSRGVFNIVIKADDMAMYDFMFNVDTGDVEFAEYYRETFTRWMEGELIENATKNGGLRAGRSDES